MEKIRCPKCKSTDVYIEDASFDHAFGVEVIKYPVCNSCGYDEGEEEDWFEEEK